MMIHIALRYRSRVPALHVSVSIGSFSCDLLGRLGRAQKISGKRWRDTMPTAMVERPQKLRLENDFVFVYGMFWDGLWAHGIYPH